MDGCAQVFGGIPPAAGAGTEEGFSEWATSVQEKPMAVRYTLSYIFELSAFADLQQEARQVCVMCMFQFGTFVFSVDELWPHQDVMSRVAELASPVIASRTQFVGSRS